MPGLQIFFIEFRKVPPFSFSKRFYHKSAFDFVKCFFWLDVVAHVYNSSYSGSGDRRIMAQAPAKKTLSQRTSWVWCFTSAITATWEAQEG
jgi:hypothetical protein